MQEMQAIGSEMKTVSNVTSPNELTLLLLTLVEFLKSTLYTRKLRVCKGIAVKREAHKMMGR